MAYKLGEGAVRQLQGLFRGTPKKPPQTFFRPAPPLEAAPQGIQFYNDSGETMPAFAIFAVTGEYTDGFPAAIVNAQKSSTTFKQRYLVNGPYDVPYRGFGQAQTGRVQKILYDPAWSPTNGQGGGPKPGEWKLFQNYPQTSIVDAVHDSTAKLMLATLGVIDKLVGYTGSTIGAASGDISSGGLTPGSGAVKVCYFDGTKWLKVNDSYTVTGYNLSTGTVAANIPLQLKNINGLWQIDWEDCA